MNSETRPAPELGIHLYTYRAFGLTIASEIAFPELAPVSGSPDVVVRLASVAPHLDDPVRKGVMFEAKRGEYLLTVDGAARYAVNAGREVLVDVEPGVPLSHVRFYFLGSVVTALLHQRGALVLHAAAVIGVNGALLIAGHSGRGKSTLVTALLSRGLNLLADDASAVTLDSEGGPLVQPGFPVVRLWNDSLELLGRSALGLERVLPGTEKYSVPMANYLVEPQSLHAVVVLEIHNSSFVETRPLNGAEAFAALRTQTRNLRVLEGLQMQAAHFQLASAVAARVPVLRVARPRGRDSIAEIVDHLLPFLD